MVDELRLLNGGTAPVDVDDDLLNPFVGPRLRGRFGAKVECRICGSDLATLLLTDEPVSWANNRKLRATKTKVMFGRSVPLVEVWTLHPSGRVRHRGEPEEQSRRERSLRFVEGVNDPFGAVSLKCRRCPRQLRPVKAVTLGERLLAKYGKYDSYGNQTLPI